MMCVLVGRYNKRDICSGLILRLRRTRIFYVRISSPEYLPSDKTTHLAWR